MKRASKQQREQKILLSLIDLYIETGRPIGSNTLKEESDEDLSSATIRNYFAELEKEGYLSQQHASGGRIPTSKAFRFYAKEVYQENEISKDGWKEIRSYQEKEINGHLQSSAELLSEETNSAIFLSAPRFDHDFILNMKIVPLDIYRSLVVVITDFGALQTEIVQTSQKMNTFSIKRMESYFYWRLTGTKPKEPLLKEEEQEAQKIYNEILTRYISKYSHFTEEEIYRTGFSRLLSYSEFHEPIVLANTLSLFENPKSMRLLLRETMAKKTCCFWIGDDLDIYTPQATQASVISIPYSIHNQVVGAVALIGPMRMPYRRIFPLLKSFQEALSESLTKSVYKFKISYRQPSFEDVYLQKEEKQMIGKSNLMLLEQKAKRL